MHLIISNYGNDSIALIQWAFEQQLKDVHVLYVETGWAASEWSERVTRGEIWVKQLGFNPVHLMPTLQFKALVIDKGEFPTTKFQWCAGILKGLPILDWLDQVDSRIETTILLGSRRDASRRFAYLEEFLQESEHYGDRKVWHPLFLHTLTQRDELIKKTPFPLVTHRSLECDPCVNSNEIDFQRISLETIVKAVQLEQAVGRPMFHVAELAEDASIYDVITWAKQQSPSSNTSSAHFFDMGCGSPYGCGL